MAVSKKLYEYIIYSFKARNLEISNMLLLSRNIAIFRFYEHFKKFREICFARIFAKFTCLAKKININGISRSHALKWSVHTLKVWIFSETPSGAIRESFWQNLLTKSRNQNIFEKF